MSIICKHIYIVPKSSNLFSATAWLYIRNVLKLVLKNVRKVIIRSFHLYLHMYIYSNSTAQFDTYKYKIFLVKVFRCNILRYWEISKILFQSVYIVYDNLFPLIFLITCINWHNMAIKFICGLLTITLYMNNKLPINTVFFFMCTLFL